MFAIKKHPDEYGEIRLYAHRMVRHAATAEDIVQETFLRLSQQKEPPKERRAWLYKTARNLSIDLLRRQKKFQEIHDFLIYRFQNNLQPPSPAKELEQQETLAMLLEKLNELSPRHREAIRLKFQEKLTYDEIAVVMEISRSSVGWLLHEAIGQLRKAMNPKNSK
ncbi:MAG: sigma-70 family RNA polymerase sigma factor [Planctomycetia bacterium]|nr:sigma-70 family RNA polymerase sigma factor [Planctomycetia bacterium]